MNNRQGFKCSISSETTPSYVTKEGNGQEQAAQKMDPGVMENS